MTSAPPQSYFWAVFYVIVVVAFGMFSVMISITTISVCYRKIMDLQPEPAA